MELPEEFKESAAERTEQIIKELGAAAGLAVIEEEEAKKQQLVEKAAAGRPFPGCKKGGTANTLSPL